MFLEKKRMFYLSLLNLLVGGRRDQAEGQSQLLQFGAPSLLINLAGMLFDGGGNQSLLTQHERPVVTRT